MKDENLREKIKDYLKAEISACWEMGGHEDRKGNEEGATMWMWSRNAYEHILHTLEIPNFYSAENKK